MALRAVEHAAGRIPEAGGSPTNSALGDAHPHNIAALNNLALLYQAKGDKDKEEAMRMLTKMLQARSDGPGA